MLTIQEPEAPEEGCFKTAGGFRKDGVDYPIGGFMYVTAGVFEPLEGAIKQAEKPEYASKGRFVKGGANHGLLARGICQLLSVSDKGTSQKKLKDSGNVCVGKIRVRRLFHPEEVDQDAAYEASSHWEVYWSDMEVTIDAEDVVGRCTVGGRGIATGALCGVCVCGGCVCVWWMCVCGGCAWHCGCMYDNPNRS